MALKVCIRPEYSGEGVGGVERVVAAQRRYLPQFDVEIVHDPMDADLFIGHVGDWCDREDIPRIAFSHGLYWSDPIYTWPDWARSRNASIARTYVEADAVITPAEWVANVIRRDLWAPVTVIPNGIDPELLDVGTGTGDNRSRVESFVYWNKARVDAVCEIDSLVRLAQKHPTQRFEVTAVSPKQLPPNATSIGVIPYQTALQKMREAGVYLATTREVHGVSVLEALACGTPVLGYAWGGQREQLPELFKGDDRYPKPYWRQGGILVAPGNIQALSQGLESLQDPAIWQSMSEAGRERAREFAWPLLIEKLATFLHDFHSAWPGHRPSGSPEISVVIPCYNLGTYLPKAVMSVLEQEGAPPFEIIIVDDASTDDSYSVAMSLCAEGERRGVQMTCLRNPSNLYLAEALNAGIRIARGRWIINLDPDNVLPPKALQALTRAAGRNPQLDCVYGRMKLVREDGSPDERWGSGGYASPPWPPREFDYGKQIIHETQVHSSAMFKRRMWERIGGYRQYTQPDEKGAVVRLNSDAEFWTRAASLGFRFGHATNETTLIYRVRLGSMSRTVPEWDWQQTSPDPNMISLGAPIDRGRVLTHEPIHVSVIVTEAMFGDAAPIVESLWPQTFDRWEVFVVRPKGTEAITSLPPYVRIAFTEEEALSRTQGKWKLRLEGEEIAGLLPDALMEFTKDSKRAPGLYDRNDSTLKGKIMAGCGSCGGGMRVAASRQVFGGQRNSGSMQQMRAAGAPSARAPLSGKTTKVHFSGSGARTLWIPRINPDTHERQKYVFSSDKGHQDVNVYDEDLPFVLRNSQYKIATDDDDTADLEEPEMEPELVAASVAPPQPRPGPEPQPELGPEPPKNRGGRPRKQSAG